jgi:tetratricopeptide (TPR) repeat protein
MCVRENFAVPAIAFLTLLAGCSQTPQQREAGHLKRGLHYLADKSYKKAVIEFKVASQNMPKDPEPIYRLGMVYLSAGAIRQAVESFQKVLTLDPKHAAARYQLALFKAGSGKPELLQEAKREISAWSASHPGDAEALATTGLIEAKLGNRDEAIRLLETGMAKDPSLVRVEAAILGFYARKQDSNSANAMARDVAEKMPKSPDAAVLRAQVSLAMNDFADADAQIARALSIKRDFEPALRLRLWREMMAGNQNSAEETTQELSRLPEKRLWSAYARILFADKKIDKGIAEFERALKEHGDDNDLRDDYAVTLQVAGRRKEAEAVVARTLSRDPRDRRGLLIRTDLEIDRGNLEAASKDIQTLLGQGGPSAEISFQEARIFGARGDRIREGDLLTEALKSEPGMLPARLRLSRVLVASGKARNAVALLDQAPAPQKDVVGFVVARNGALMASGEWEEVRKSLDYALSRIRSPGLLNQDALLRARQHDLAGARKSLEESFTLEPSDAVTINFLGNVMREQGDTAGYIAKLKQAVAKNPKSAALQDALGNVLSREGDGTGARAAFEAAEASGDTVGPEMEIALLDVRSGRVEQARQRLLTLVKDHDSARARLSLAEIEAGRGSIDAAVLDCLKAIQLEPGNAIAMNNLAGLLSMKQHKFEDALFWGRKALALAPANPVVEDTVGWAYYLAGRYDVALPYLEKSEQSLDRPVARYHLAAALLKSGDAGRARREYELALKADPGSPERSSIERLFASR